MNRLVFAGHLHRDGENAMAKMFENNGQKRYYKMLDIVKLACSGLVVMIHQGFGDSFAIIPCLTRQAVPFFFLVSGFFYAKRANNAKSVKSYTLSFAKRLLLIYLFWIVCWLPYIIKETVSTNAEKSILYVFFVIIRRVALAGWVPYWYILVFAEGIIILSLILRYQKYKLGWLFCICGLALNVVYRIPIQNGFCNLLNKGVYFVFSSESNVVMTGFPLLFIGAAAARHEDAIRHWKWSAVLLLYLLFVGGAFLLHPYSNRLFGIPFGILQALPLFALCLILADATIPVKNETSRLARDLSAVIYLTHTITLSILGYGLHLWNELLRFIIVVFVAMLVVAIGKKINWKPLKTVLMIH